MAVISNEERSSATRIALLDASITALVRFGYYGATSTRIAEISGLTRGAQMHHFKTKAALMVTALLHLHARQLEHWMHVLTDMGETVSPKELVDVLWASFEDDLWLAAAELWVAARTDDQLREAIIPAEREISRRVREKVAPLLKADHADNRPDKLSSRRRSAIIGLIFSTMRGMAMHEAFDPNTRRAKDQRSELVKAVSALLEQ